MTTTTLWYATRATGIVALVLLTGTVMLGVAGTARAASPRWPRIVTAGLHRNLSLTAAALVGVHVITTVLDPFAAIGLVAAFIPFSSDYRPLWLSLGAVAFDLLLAVLITSLLRDRLNHRAWQLVHLLVYVCWPVALWHGLGTGTDTRLPFVLAIDVACVAAVAWAVWWRLRMAQRRALRAGGLLTLAFVPLLTAIFVYAGPLRPGWSLRAGTPAALLGSHVPAGAAQGRGRPGTASPDGSRQSPKLTAARFAGHLTVRDGPGAHRRTVTITGRTKAAPRRSFVIVLRGTPAGSGISLTAGTVTIGRPGTAGAYSGPVVRLAGHELVAAVSGQAGQRSARFVLIVKGTAVTGTVTLVATEGE